MRYQFLIASAVIAVCVPASVGAQIATEEQRWQSLEHYRNAIELMSAEKFDRAAGEFSAAIADDHLMAFAHYGLGQAHMQLRQYPKAIEAFTGALDAFRQLHALSLEKANAKEMQYFDSTRELRDTLGRMEHTGSDPLRQMRVEQMLTDLERDRQKGPSATFRPPAEVLLALGSAHFRNGDRMQAENSWKAAIESNPALGEAHNNLAVIYMQTGRLDEAEQEIAVAEKNGFRVNPQFKADLRKLRNRH